MPNQKRVYIIHGWGGSPERGFNPWLKKELEQRGFIVEIPVMPDTDNPKINEWIPYMHSVITDPDENTIIVGHSLGGQAILRYLAELPNGVQIKKTVLVAPVVDAIKNLDLEDKRISQNWINTPINQERARRGVKEIVAFFSDNDPWIPLLSERVLREKYGARTIVEHNMGHYSDDENRNEAPSALAEIVK